jgi:MFS family permease
MSDADVPNVIGMSPPAGSSTVDAAAADQLSLAKQRRRPLRALWAASVLGGLGQSLAGTAGALLAREVGGSESVAGLPQALLVAGSAIAAVALSRLTARYGRGPALSMGAAAAVAGCVVVIVAAITGNLVLVLAGTLLLGAGNTAVMLGRYAAADLAVDQSRATAMSHVLVAITVGAVAGPNLLAPASRLATSLGMPGLAGPYLIAALAFAAASAALGAGVRPARSAAQTAAAAAAPRLGALARTPLGRGGLAGLVVLGLANLVMVSVMTMAPVQMHHTGSGLVMIGVVVSLHITGMFAPSPISGWLTDRFGAPATAAAAGATLVIASWLAAMATSGALLAVGLVLLGVGWNLALLSGSALLTADVPAAERPQREGWGEVGMGVAAAGGGAASGAVMADGGYGLLAASGAAVASLVLPAAWRASGGRPAADQPSAP